MTERRFFLEHKVKDFEIIDNEEFNHLKNVLRLGVGDNITLVCGDGWDYHAKIVDICKREAKVEVFERVKNNNDPKLKVTLFLGVVKNDSFSSITTRMSELGVSAIVPFQCERSGLKSSDVKIEKMQKVANMAIKQCDMSTPLKVYNVCSFDDMLKQLQGFDEVFFAYEAKEASAINLHPNGTNIAVIVGPIGGFSDREANTIKNIANVKCTSLGRRIMRVETACASIVAVLMYESGEWNLK